MILPTPLDVLLVACHAPHRDTNSPEQLRGLSWHVITGGDHLMRSSGEGEYETLVQRGGVQKNEDEILRDLGRTFPTHVYFTDRQGQGQRSLYRVLRAYAAMDPEVRL